MQSGVGPSSSLLCSGWCANDKSINYLFVYCDFFGHIWFHVMWLMLGISGVHQSDIHMHVLQLCVLIYFGKHSTLFLGDMVGVYLGRVEWTKLTIFFCNKALNLDQLLDRVNLFSCGESHKPNSVFFFYFNFWWSSPLACIDYATM